MATTYGQGTSPQLEGEGLLNSNELQSTYCINAQSLQGLNLGVEKTGIIESLALRINGSSFDKEYTTIIF